MFSRRDALRTQELGGGHRDRAHGRSRIESDQAIVIDLVANIHALAVDLDVVKLNSEHKLHLDIVPGKFADEL